MPNRIKKKICTKFWFMVVDFPQIPIARSGILKIPSGSTPCPRASAPASVRRFAPHSGLRYGPRARRAALGDFQNPLQAQGIWVKIPSQKPEFLIYIFL